MERVAVKSCPCKSGIPFGHHVKSETTNISVTLHAKEKAIFYLSFSSFEKRKDASLVVNIGGKTLEVFFWLLRAVAAEVQFPFHWKGWPKARVGTPALAVRPMPVTRNSDAHITTPPFGHPFLK